MARYKTRDMPISFLDARSRRDARPENMVYQLSGCEISPAPPVGAGCLGCPLEDCIDGPARVIYLYQQRLTRVFLILDEGLSPAEVVARLESEGTVVSERTILRMAVKWRERNAESAGNVIEFRLRTTIVAEAA